MPCEPVCPVSQYALWCCVPATEGTFVPGSEPTFPCPAPILPAPLAVSGGALGQLDSTFATNFRLVWQQKDPFNMPRFSVSQVVCMSLYSYITLWYVTVWSPSIPPPQHTIVQLGHYTLHTFLIVVSYFYWTSVLVPHS